MVTTTVTTTKTTILKAMPQMGEDVSSGNNGDTDAEVESWGDDDC
jgi:hypothetical protein